MSGSQIAAQSAELSKGKKGSQRVIRLATGASTQRSELDAEHLTKRLQEVAVEQLEQAPEEELWLIADSSDLRKPYAEVMPYLMQVRDLDEKLVPGYFPSSQLCHQCGWRWHDITLADRVFVCQNEICRYEGDRDYNASLNILNEALRLIGAAS